MKKMEINSSNGRPDFLNEFILNCDAVRGWVEDGFREETLHEQSDSDNDVIKDVLFKEVRIKRVRAEEGKESEGNGIVTIDVSGVNVSRRMQKESLRRTCEQESISLGRVVCSIGLHIGDQNVSQENEQSFP